MVSEYKKDKLKEVAENSQKEWSLIIVLQDILSFNGKWRTYQERVLQKADQYLSDGKIHIVAAPGSGKTTLGIELIRKMNEKALVLAPSITIREQRIDRIKEAFLDKNLDAEEYLSQNLKNPKLITVVTYQALHSAMTNYKGIQKEENESLEENNQTEEVDYSDFRLIEEMQTAGIGVLCLDECHHLRSEWWKALENFKKEMGSLKVIALTATPPYDSVPAMWTRYMGMCGEIDEEITIPELVKEKSLCPHQDYVYFNYPTREETQTIQKFEQKAQEMVQFLMEDKEFQMCMQSFKGLHGEISNELLLENPSLLSSLLIYLQSKNLSFPKYLQRLLGAKKLPPMNEKWMQILLQDLLYDHDDLYFCDKTYKEQLITRLKAEGFIEKKKVLLETNQTVEKMLTNSIGKCHSMLQIVFHEYQQMGKELRLLILTDYIKKEYEKAVGRVEMDVNALGVVPFFEMLRRENEKRKETIRFGILCGSLVVIPADAKDALEQEIANTGKVSYCTFGSITDYIMVTPIGDAHFLTAAITNLFSEGWIQVLIGTKSLLGEGWDSPCINSLILASFVGSFMLSNQMRGRAIRMDKKNPDKASNIWHLVCLRPWKEVLSQNDHKISEDFSLLERKMEHFLGLHYTEDVIENGMERLSIITNPLNASHVEQINKKMLAMSGQRQILADRWQKSLAVYEKMDVVEETTVPDQRVTAVIFWDALRDLGLSIGFSIFCFLMYGMFVSTDHEIFLLFLGLGIVGFLAGILKFPKLFMLGSPLRRLKAFGNGIWKALEKKGMFEEPHSRVKTETALATNHAVYLSGGSGRDKALFAQCVNDFFEVVDNQRYLLVNPKRHKSINGYYCVPDVFSKKKEEAELFAECMKPYIGKYEVVYTRSESGRKILLEARIYAMANREERCLTKKKVKNALE